MFIYFDAGAVWLGDCESKQMSESVTATGTDWVVQPPSEGNSKSELHFQKMSEFFKKFNHARIIKSASISPLSCHLPGG